MVVTKTRTGLRLDYSKTGLEMDWNFMHFYGFYTYFINFNIIASTFQDRLLNELMRTYYCYALALIF